MARGTTEEILKFVMQAEGEDALVPFIKSTKALEGASDETKKAADALLTELGDASALKKSIESFQKLEATIAATGEKSTAAKAKVDALAAEIAATEAPTKAQTKAFQDASRSAEGLEKRLKAQKDELAILRAGLQVANVSTDDFAKGQVEITARCNAARLKLEELSKATTNLSAKTEAVTADTSQFTDKLGILRKGFDATKAKLGEIAEGVGGLSTQFTELNQAAEIAGKVLGTLSNIGGFLGDQINEVGKFELALAQVEVRTKATTEESKLLRSAIQDALQNSAVSAGAAAEALRLMAEDGANATEAAQNLGQAVAFAQAGTRGLSDTVQGLGAVLDVFNEGPAKIGALADSITATAAAAGTSTKAIEDGLAGVGVAAEQAELSLDETVALIGVLAQRGVEGSRAGAQLTKVLQELSDPASKAGEALKTAGIDGSDLSGVLQRLATDSTTAEAVLAALGDKPRSALKLLLSEGGKSLEGFTEVVRTASGATQEASDILGDKFALAMDRAAAAIENARNTFLEPILEPLAKELNTFATDFNEFAQSPEFARLRDQFTRVASEGIKALGQFAKSIDFEAATGRISDFAETTITAMERVAAVVNFVGGAFGTVWDGAAALGASAVDVIASGNEILIGSFAEVSDTAKEVSTSYGAIAADARKLRDESLGSLADRFGLTTKEAQKFGKSLDDVANKAQQAKLDLDKLAEALPKNDIVAIAQRWGLLAKPLEDIADGATGASAGLNKAKAAAIAASLAFERLQVSILSAAIADLARAGQATSQTFAILVQKVGEAEGRINALTAEQQKLAQQTEGVADSTNRATEALSRYGSAASAAADSAGEVKSSNSQVSESFGNIARQSSAVEVSLGNITESYARLAIEAAGASGSIRDYARVVSGFFEVAEQQDAKIADRIRLLQSLNGTLDEEAQIRRQLEQIWGTGSVRLEELVQIELKRLEVRRESLQLGKEEIEQEKERQSLIAGGINYNASAGTDTAPTTATTGARSATVELVLRNETAANGTPMRLSADQATQIARTVLDILRQDMNSAGR